MKLLIISSAKIAVERIAVNGYPGSLYGFSSSGNLTLLTITPATPSSEPIIPRNTTNVVSWSRPWNTTRIHEMIACEVRLATGTPRFESLAWLLKK